jgi:hypothetical protein
MLQMPRRSVTRFFIPLIDVLTLLFCIFLMMPAVKKVSEAEAASPGEKGRPTPEQLDEREKAVAEKERELRQELSRVRRDAADQVLSGLYTRVFEIDPKTGELFYWDPDRVNVAGPEQVRDLLRRDQNRAGPGHEIYYAIMAPHDPTSSYPLKSQLKDYDEKWFADVKHSVYSPFK